MKTKMKQALAQMIIGSIIFIMAVYAMVEMIFSTTFLAVYDTAGNWHWFPHLTRYFLYIVLVAIAIGAVYTVYFGGKYLLRKAKKLF